MIKYNKLHCIEILLNCGCSQVSSVLTDWPQVAWPSTQNRQCDQTGRNFAFWVFILKIHDVKYVKRYVCINVDKNGWATFWAIFPQNPLVTLSNRVHMCRAGLTDFSWYKIPKRGKNVPKYYKIT
jgi:hypothetical protein